MPLPHQPELPQGLTLAGQGHREPVSHEIGKPLRYLLWVAALLSPRPPSLLGLNEPETSLHADLLPALAALISEAATRTQVIAVSHASQLLDPLATSARTAGTELTTIELAKEFGETVVAGSDAFDGPAWHWPKR